MIEEMINKTLDYTRGNNTYLQCVNNNLEYTARAVSNMEYGLRSDIQDLRSDFQSAAVGMYNMGQGIRNDIQSMAMGVTSAIHESTYEIVASQQRLANTFSHGFSAVNNTLNFGFELVGNKIDVLSEDVSSKLDEIQDILNNPRLTQSRELYREALRSYTRGFYEEALADCLGAIEKNKTDYISWYLLGLIYLYGAGENSNVINLDKAEEALTNAAKYIKPDIPKSNEAKLLASDIYYNLGFSRLAKSNDYLIENKVDDSNTKLLEAEEASSMAYQLSQENLLARYEQAKELHFLGKDDETIKLLEELIRKNKNFAIKAINDKNFESIWSDIKKLIERLKLEVCDLMRESLDEFVNTLSSKFDVAHEAIIEDLKNENIQCKEKLINEVLLKKEENNKGFIRKKDELQAKYADIEQKDYFTVLDFGNELYKDLEDINSFVTSLIELTDGLIKIQIADERKREKEERKKHEEKYRQLEEEHRQQLEIQKKHEEEILKKKEIEAEKLKREEEWKNFNKKSPLWTFISLIPLIVQWGFILYFRNLSQLVPFYVGFISIVGGLLGYASGIVGCILWGTSTVFLFNLWHPILGTISLLSTIFIAIMFGGTAVKTSHEDLILSVVCLLISICCFISQFLIMEEHQIFAIILFIISVLCGFGSHIIGSILWIGGAILLFLFGHTIMGVISCITALIALVIGVSSKNTKCPN